MSVQFWKSILDLLAHKGLSFELDWIWANTNLLGFLPQPNILFEWWPSFNFTSPIQCSEWLLWPSTDTRVCNSHSSFFWNKQPYRGLEIHCPNISKAQLALLKGTLWDIAGSIIPQKNSFKSRQSWCCSWSSQSPCCKLCICKLQYQEQKGMKLGIWFCN